MDTRQTNILDAAMRVFSQRGVRKATMADVAEAADVSRQTLYNQYANKDELIRATIRDGIQRMRTEFEIAAKGQDLGGVLDGYFNAGPIQFYDMFQAAPEAADMLEGFSAAAADVIAEADQQWRNDLARLIDPFVGTSGFEPVEIADFIYSSAYSIKHNATDRDQLLRRLSMLKTAVVAMAGG